MSPVARANPCDQRRNLCGRPTSLRSQRDRDAMTGAVALPPALRSRRMEFLEGTAERKDPLDLVFGNRAGKPLREAKVLQRVLQPAAQAAGLGRVTWHQFRHIHSSLLNDLRVPVKIAQEQLGHASIQTTLNIYTHVVDASHRAAIESLEERLFPTVPKSQKADTSPATLSVSKRVG